MPKFTVKTKYIEKLKQLGVYDKWLTNVKNNHYAWDAENKIEKYLDFNYFIQWSFNWSLSIEGHTYWDAVANSDCDD